MGHWKWSGSCSARKTWFSSTLLLPPEVLQDFISQEVMMWLGNERQWKDACCLRL